MYGSVKEYAVKQAVDVGDLETRVVQRALAGLRVEPEAGHVRHLADVGFADADDGDFALERPCVCHFVYPAARSNCGSMAPSPRSSNVSLTRSPIATSSAFGADDVREHARPVVEVDQRDHVRHVRGERRRRRAVHDAEAVHGPTALAFHPLELVRPAVRAQVARHEVPVDRTPCTGGSPGGVRAPRSSTAANRRSEWVEAADRSCAGSPGSSDPRLAEHRFLERRRRQLPRAGGWRTHFGVDVHVDHARPAIAHGLRHRVAEILRFA